MDRRYFESLIEDFKSMDKCLKEKDLDVARVVYEEVMEKMKQYDDWVESMRVASILTEDPKYPDIDVDFDDDFF